LARVGHLQDICDCRPRRQHEGVTQLPQADLDDIEHPLSGQVGEQLQALVTETFGQLRAGVVAVACFQ